MRVSSGAFQPATPRPDDPTDLLLLKSYSLNHCAAVAAQAINAQAAGVQHSGIAEAAGTPIKAHASPTERQQQGPAASQQQPKPQDTREPCGQHKQSAQEAAGNFQDNEDPTAGKTTDLGHVAVGGKSKTPFKHRSSTVVRVSQQAIRCLESYEAKLLLELQSILQQTALSTAASAAAGAAVGAGAAVAAAEQALTGRAARLRDGLLSPPDSARSARALAMQEFRRQPGAVCALGLQAQMSAQLEAAEAKLHVHRTAATTAKVKIQQLEVLVQQLQLKQQQQQEQLCNQQQHMDTQQERLQQQDQHILQLDAEMQQHQLLLQQQRQELALRDKQLAEAEVQLQAAREQLQQQELNQWREISTYSSLDEQDLRQQQEQLLQEQEEQQMVEQQLRWRQEELELHQQLLTQQKERQQEQQQQIRTEAQQLQQQQERILQQQRQLEHQQQELLLMQQQAEQVKQELAAQQHQLLSQQAILAQQQEQADVSKLHLTLSASLRDIAQAVQAVSLQETQPVSVGQHRLDVPPLPLYKVPTTAGGLVEQITATLAATPPSPERCARAAAMHSGCSATGLQQGDGCSGTGGAAMCAEQDGACSASDAAAAAAAAAGDAAGADEPGSCQLGVGTDEPDTATEGESSSVAQPMQEQQQGQVRDDPMQQQQHLPLYLPEWGQPSMDSHQDWQLIVSPSNMAPAEERRYHASTFSKVLQHLAPTGSPDNRTQPQPQQRDLVRVAEYMEALAADNTVLSCEVFHLQQLLVEQRRSASSSCEAVARKLASKAVKLSWELQQAELQLQLQQAASDVAQSDSSRHREDTDGVVVDEGGAAGEFVEGRRESSAAVRMASICDAVADKLKGMLAQHAARVKDLLEQLDEDVDACCSQYDDAANAAELEQQLSQFEQAYDLMLHESENGQLQDDPSQPPDLHPAAPTAMPTTTQTAAAAAAASGQVGSLSHRVPHSPRTAGGSKPFVTSPSGHVSLLPSRRTSAVQQQQQQQQQSMGAGSRRASSVVQQQQSSVGGGIPNPSVDAAAQGPAAAALIKRRSRLAKLLVGQVGLVTSLSSAAAGSAADANIGAASGVQGLGPEVASQGGGAAALQKEAGERHRVSRLVHVLEGRSACLRASLEAGDQPAAAALAAAVGSDTGPAAGQQQQEQQQQEGSAYVRPRGKTCDVLTEVAARLQSAAACGPGREGESSDSSRGAVGAVEAVAVAAMAADGRQKQQQQEGDDEQGEPQAASWMARAGWGQQQQQQGGMVGLGGGPRPDPSPSARLLVQAILEASLATAVADAQQHGCLRRHTADSGDDGAMQQQG